ncbi:arginyltransferase [Acetobacter sp. AN02]|uniref:arginyltransferase n=1 Tax=Acetobacter sp. AN02 TaxID=2894186 RepID=UPI00243457B7|nr:arginyltransferase [Acetobacter sp. AN02]MDG6094548.1 arginyltransferase [Acetobacter sp. AN02]
MTYPVRHPQLFYTTAPLPCPYLAGKTERKVVTDLSGPDADILHNRLSQAGFRRSHAIAYAPVCHQCSACIPIRLPVGRFRPDRTQRRIFRRNADTDCFDVPPCATTEQYELFRKYQSARHCSGDMVAMSFQDYRGMVEETPVETCICEFRDAEGRLIAATLTDVLNDGLSAVYTFYDPDMQHRSLGTYAVMMLAEFARRQKLPYVYLGYWIAQSPKMAYKARFRPAEILIRGAWRELEAQTGALPA